MRCCVKVYSAAPAFHLDMRIWHSSHGARGPGGHAQDGSNRVVIKEAGQFGARTPKDPYTSFFLIGEKLCITQT